MRLVPYLTSFKKATLKIFLKRDNIVLLQYGLSMQKKRPFDKLFLPYVILSSSIASFFLLILIFSFY